MLRDRIEQVRLAGPHGDLVAAIELDLELEHRRNRHAGFLAGPRRRDQWAQRETRR